MAHISVTPPAYGQTAWDGPMNALLQALVTKINLMDDQIVALQAAQVPGGGGTTPGAVTHTEIGDGFYTVTGTGVIDNGDGFFTISDTTVTDNGDGFLTLAA